MSPQSIVVGAHAIEPAWLERGAGSAERRPIDVLVQACKSSRYVLEQLVPALRRGGFGGGPKRLGG